eukprot:TRINITY_DN93060_c0_g1_i1.p1 TRINITY_DN93060_c0_g1~~TRINITY_DN93060_c0_g1_i1.p1  ORF type:complete len:221 (+),score=49.96 TRINITY_DN93060_c0_g1_i1:41-664(+)
MQRRAEVSHYEILQVAPNATTAEIKKAYYSRAMVVHPDKRPDTEKAVAEKEFQTLQKSYEIISDTKAREAYDAVLAAQVRVAAARAVQSQSMDARRRKLQQELEEREKEAATARDLRTEEQVLEAVREQLQREMERLKRQQQQRHAAQHAAATGAAPFASPATKRPAQTASPMSEVLLQEKEDTVFALLRAKARRKTGQSSPNPVEV